MRRKRRVEESVQTQKGKREKPLYHVFLTPPQEIFLRKRDLDKFLEKLSEKRGVEVFVVRGTSQTVKRVERLVIE